MGDFTGIYGLPEAGQYLYITSPKRPPDYRTVHRWVRSGLPKSEIRDVPASELFLNFEDLVSLRMIVALRSAGFSLQHIKKVDEWLRKVTGYHHPFAMKDLWISDTEIFVEMAGKLSATRQGQYAMDFITRWLRQIRRPINGTIDLTFKKSDGNEIASSWTPHNLVVLDPLVQFGSPCLEHTRITTKGVWSMYIGGDRPENIARDYGVPLAKIEAGIQWEEKIASIAR